MHADPHRIGPTRSSQREARPGAMGRVRSASVDEDSGLAAAIAKGRAANKASADRAAIFEKRLKPASGECSKSIARPVHNHAVGAKSGPLNYWHDLSDLRQGSRGILVLVRGPDKLPERWAEIRGLLKKFGTMFGKRIRGFKRRATELIAVNWQSHLSSYRSLKL